VEAGLCVEMRERESEAGIMSRFWKHFRYFSIKKIYISENIAISLLFQMPVWKTTFENVNIIFKIKPEKVASRSDCITWVGGC